MDRFGLTKYLNSFEFKSSKVLGLINILKESKTIEHEDAQDLKSSYLEKLEEIENTKVSTQELKDYLSTRLKEGFDVSRIWDDFDKEKLNEDYRYDSKLKYDREVMDKIVGVMKEVIINS